MASIIVRGRGAWIAAIGFGILLIIVGLATSQIGIVVGGSAFSLFGIVFLILSLVTRGATD